MPFRRGEVADEVHEGSLFFRPFLMSGVAGDGDRAASGNEGEAFLEAFQGGFCPGSEVLVAGGKVAQVVDDEMRSVRQGEIVDIGMGEAVQNGGFLMLG